LHGAYGIAIGLTPALTDGVLTLTCGMAYDCSGRNLIVEQDRAISLPKQIADAGTLVLRHDATSADGVALVFKAASDVNPNREIALARLKSDAGNVSLDPQFRPVVARPLARPRLFSGTTIPGQTPWKPWVIGQTELGVEVKVDTSAAGYTVTPHYFAEARPDQVPPDFVPAWFTSIAEPSAESFKLRLMLRRITRESLEIMDPQVQVAAAPTLARQIELSQGNQLVGGDHVAQLLPIAQRLSSIKSLSAGIATLDDPLDEFTNPKPVAFGNLARVSKVTSVQGPASFIDVTVDTPDSFHENDVVVKLGAHPEKARAAVVASIDDAGVLEFLTPISGLAEDDVLGVAQQKSTVATVAGPIITVDDPTPFAVDDVVVRLGNAVETSAPSRIVKKAADGTLTLSSAIAGLQRGSALGIAGAAGTVLSVADNTKEVKIQVETVAPFRAGDLVAKMVGRMASRPVRVQGVKTSTRTLTLSDAIVGLAQGDTIAAADFRTRVTVQSVLGNSVTVADAAAIPRDAYVTQLDAMMRGTRPAVVSSSAGVTLTLDPPIDGLAAGNVLGLCAFPCSVSVQSILDDGTVVVSDADIVHPGDLVSARRGAAIVADTAGTSVRLAAGIAGLTSGDDLSVITVRGVANVTPGNSPLKVKIDQPSRLRAGDFLADVAGWRQASASNAYVLATNANQITVSALLDGLLPNDTVGLANVVRPYLRLRLDKIPDLVPGDELLIIAPDRLQGTTVSTFATLVWKSTSTNTVVLVPEGSSEPFTIRPGDIAASVLFVRGSALAVIAKANLYVSWLACETPTPLPRPCAGADEPDCPCAQEKGASIR
jgi:hypothetical protein